MTTTACSCGMFAIGACQRCGEPRCGEHGTHDASGTFVCRAHLVEEARQAQQVSQSEAARKLELARKAARKEAAAIEIALPGLSVDNLAGHSLASVLQREAPGYAKQFHAGSKSFGRTIWETGWSFHLEEGYEPNEQYVLVITMSGKMLRVRCVGDRKVTPNTLLGAVPISGSELDETMRRKIVLKVLAMTGNQHLTTG